MSILFIAVPLILASVMPLVGKVSKRILPDVLANLTLLFLLVYGVLYAQQTRCSGPDCVRATIPGMELNITLVLDGFSVLLLLTIALVGLGATLFSINYMERYGSKGTFYALLLIMIAVWAMDYSSSRLRERLN